MFKSPVYNVIGVPIEKVRANSYNPNAVAPAEMKLLYDSIKEDGYTMPIVCYYLKDEDMYEIVDGFHRYSIMLKYKDIYERENGILPVSVIDKPISDRMASTKLIAACHVLRRLLMPRHSPCALLRLTSSIETSHHSLSHPAYASFKSSFVPFYLLSKLNPLRWASTW